VAIVTPALTTECGDHASAGDTGAQFHVRKALQLGDDTCRRLDLFVGQFRVTVQFVTQFDELR
jgi:hypothetical protein